MGYETRFTRRDEFLWKVKDFIYPMSTYCVSCGKIIDSSRRYAICDYCDTRIGWGHIEVDLNETEKKTGRKSCLDGVYAAMNYGPFERRLIFDLKYDGRTYMARVIAKIMFERVVSDFELAENLLASDYLIPVPISRERMKERGFNQTEKIGKYLSKYFDIPMDAKIVKRAQNTVMQKLMTKEQRFSNMENAFIVDDSLKERISGKTLCLIDDCYTTGATGNALAKVLKQAGAKTVYLYALATGNEFRVGEFEKEI